jgi:protein ImuA
MASDPIIDALGGRSARNMLHAIHPARIGHEAAACGVALGVILSLAERPDQPVLWVQEHGAMREAGRPYGPGLMGLGLAPERLIVVSVKGGMDVLAAAEMGLEEPGLAGVLAELPARLPADMLKLGKRLALRAEAQRTPCLLLHSTPEPVETPVASRWTVASRAPQQGRALFPDLTPAFDVQLTKNRFGPLGRWAVQWCVEQGLEHGDETIKSMRKGVSAHVRARFILDELVTIGAERPAHSRPLVPDVADGSPRTDAGGTGIVRLHRRNERARAA